MSEPGHGGSGFGLVETLVAIAIIAVMASLTFTVVATNASAAHALDQRRLAAMVAQSALARAVAGDTTTDGQAAGLMWRTSFQPYDGLATVGAVRLQRVDVVVSEPGNPRPLMRLQSLKIG